MNTIKGTVKNRQILVEVPDDWPEGCEVVIEPVSADDLVERPKSDVPETPEEIEDWLRWYHALEPLEFTPEEESDLAAWRQKIKGYSVANARPMIFEDRAEPELGTPVTTRRAGSVSDRSSATNSGR